MMKIHSTSASGATNSTMPTIPAYTIKEIEERAEIYDVISGEGIDLRKRGARYLGLCPFHDDKHIGNFSVYPAKNVYKCFACGASGGPVTFIMKYKNMSYPDAIRYLGKKYNIMVDDKPITYTPPPVKHEAPARPQLELPMAMVTARENTADDTLCKWIRTGIKWQSDQRVRIETVLKEYHVGHAKNDMTIFWQIDRNGVVRTGKMMRYKPDGHRDKTKGKYNFDWIHTALSRPVIVTGADGWPLFDEEGKPVTERRNLDIYDPDKQDVKIVPFGMHLVNKYPKATIQMVESEKTALLMAIAYGNNDNQIWLACGGMQMLSRERLAPLINQRRLINLYPDRDGIDAWTKQARSIGYDLITVCADPVTEWWRPEDGEKADIADIVINRLNK